MVLSIFQKELEKFENNAELYLYHDKTFKGIPLAGVIEKNNKLLLLTKSQLKDMKDEAIPVSTKEELIQVLNNVHAGRVYFYRGEVEIVFVCGSSFQSNTIWFEAYADNDMTDSFLEILAKEFQLVCEFTRHLQLLGFPADVIEECTKN